MSPENRYRKKEWQRRRFTVTRTKAIIGFVLSVIFSLMLSPAFDRAVKLLYYRTQEEGTPFSSVTPDPQKQDSQDTDAPEEAVDRLKRISEQGRNSSKQEKKEN